VTRVAVTIVFLFLTTALLFAQEIPPGVAVPIMLRSTLDVRKIQVGRPVSGEIQQDVPLPGGGKISRNSRVSGRVLEAGVRADGSSYLRISFSLVRTRHGEIPVTTSLRAIASSMEVESAQTPERSPARGEGPYNWTTIQVGDDVVYNGGGPVMQGATVVGEPKPPYGVLAELTAVPGSACAMGSGGRRLALWVFSSAACGAYGFDELSIVRSGATDPVGNIVLESKKNVHIEGGSGLLLITEAPGSAR
jgi:hypothetical protein